MTDPACGLCNDREKYPDGVVVQGCPVHATAGPPTKDATCRFCGATEGVTSHAGGCADSWRVTAPTQTRHTHDDCPACREENYQRAKADPVASVVLDALHEQDAATYNGQSNNMGQIALNAAAKIREAS